MIGHAPPPAPTRARCSVGNVVCALRHRVHRLGAELLVMGHAFGRAPIAFFPGDVGQGRGSTGLGDRRLGGGRATVACRKRAGPSCRAGGTHRPALGPLPTKRVRLRLGRVRSGSLVSCPRPRQHAGAVVGRSALDHRVGPAHTARRLSDPSPRMAPARAMCLMWLRPDRQRERHLP